MKKSCFSLFLAFIFCVLYGPSPGWGQAIFTGTPVELTPAQRQVLLGEGFCDETVFTIDHDQLNDYAKAAGALAFQFELNIGEYRLFVEMAERDIRSPNSSSTVSTPNGLITMPRGPCNTYEGQKFEESAGSSRLYIAENLFGGYITNGNVRYHIHQIENLPGDAQVYWVLCEKTKPPEPPEPPINDCVNPILELGLDANYKLYQRFNQDASALINQMEQSTFLAEKFFEEELGLTLMVHKKHVQAIPDDYCCTSNQVFDKVSNYWNKKFPCVKIDVIMLFSEGLVPGGAASRPICASQVLTPAGILYPVGIVDVDAITDRTGIAITFAHELGHILGVQAELEDCGCPYEDYCYDGTYCPDFPNTLCSPLMCTAGTNTTLWLTPWSRDKMLTRIESQCDQCLQGIQEQGDCDHCIFTAEITADTNTPIIGCNDVMNYEIEICADCDGGEADIQVLFGENWQEILNPGPFETDQDVCLGGTPSLNFYLCLQDVSFGAQACSTYTFSTRVIGINTANIGEQTTTVNVLPEDADTEIGQFSFTAIDPLAIGDQGQTNLISELSDVLSSSASCDATNKQELLVSGTLIIDVDYCFYNNSTLLMQPNANIIIQAGQSLTMNQSSILACSDMWQHIYVEPGASLVLKNAHIADAEQAILAMPGSAIDISKTTFSNNHKGIVIPAGNVQVAAFYGNQFNTGPKGLKAPRSGEQGQAGMEVHNMAGLIIGTTHPVGNEFPNSFQNLDNGILSYNSNLFVLRTTFEQLAQNPDNPTLSGRGIYAVGNGHTLTVSGFGKDAGRSSFSDCFTGIYSSGNHLNVLGHVMAEVGRGVQVLSSQNRRVNIQNNEIIANIAGVDALFNLPGNAEVSDNRIVVRSGTGIKIQEFSLGTNSWDINNNQVTVIEEGKGIWQRWGRNSQVSNNDVILLAEGKYDGIRIEAVRDATINCNRVLGSSLAGISGRGIFNFGSPGVTISCNEIDYTATGLNYWGICDRNDMRGNDIGQHTTGLLLGQYPADGNVVIHRCIRGIRGLDHMGMGLGLGIWQMIFN